MKTIALKLAILFLLFANQVFAKILTVANQTTPQVAQYNTIQAAHDAAQSGDTIYVYPSQASFNGAIISKKIILIGAGFTKINNYTDCSKIASADTIKFQESSNGSVISSINGNFKIKVIASNILIQKCMLSKIIINENLSNVLILNCYINSNQDPNAIRILDNTTLVGIKNNIILYNGYWENQGNESNSTFYVGKNSSIIVQNNIVKGFHIIYSLFANSIYISDNIFFNSYGGWDRWHNLSPNAILKNGTFYCDDDNDFRRISFVDLKNSNYHLKDNSPAKNIGSNNQDLGVYTGDYPFVDDGAPSLPTIYYMNIPATGSQKDGLQIEIKAKTNKVGL
jgi:hypothetical protein